MTTRATRTPRRRTVVALAVVLAVLIGFVIRLVDIQVVNAAEWREKSLALGMGVERTLPGARGEIVDETGAVLASNLVRYDVDIDPFNVLKRLPTDEGVTAEERWREESADIAAITGQDVDDLRALVEDDPESRWANIAQGLTTAQYEELRALGLSYLSFPHNPQRAYPDGAVGVNVLGLVGGDGAPLAGLEMSENACLAPTDGREVYERGNDGVVIPGTARVEPAVDGGTLQLTINRDLQWFMQQLIAEQVQNQEAQYGTVMVVEVGTGKIRAAAEYPTFDPNDIDASDPADRGARIFQSQFEPGSTFKPYTAAMVLEHTGVTPTETTVPAQSQETFDGGLLIGDVDPHPGYDYTLTGALVDSSNVATTKFGAMVDGGIRHDYLEKLGVGSKSDIDFPGESATMLHDMPWNSADTLTSTFGQSFTVTVPTVASLYQAIANGGEKIPLSLVESCTASDGEVTEPDPGEPVRIMQEDTADEVTLMLENVYQQVHNHDVIEVPGYRAATKTGTAQIAEDGRYKSGIFYTTMAGFAPADDPQYVVILTLDEPMKNRLSSANAPGWQKAMTQVLKTYRVLPTGSDGPEILPKYH